MTPSVGKASRTYLRVGAGVFPVYGDELRGWSPRADDFKGLQGCSPFVYQSLDELFFALVNLWVAGNESRFRN